MRVMISELRKVIKEELVKTLGEGGVFDSGDIEALHLLVHDKKHAFDDNFNIPALDKAIKHLSQKCKFPLYRGVHYGLQDAFDLTKKFGDIIKFDGYLSFSEDYNVAKEFGNGIVLHLEQGAIGFNYSEWLRKELIRLKNEDYEEYDGMDGDYMIETCDEEREWILPGGEYVIIVVDGNDYYIQQK